MPDPIRIRSGSAGKQWPEAVGWFLHTGLLPDRIRLNKTWHNQPELNRTRAGFAQYYPGRLWKNGIESESGKLVADRLRLARNRARWFPYSLLPDQMRLANTLTRPSRSDPGRFCTMWSVPSLENGAETDAGSRIWLILRPDSGCTLATMAITGRNQNASGLDPACLLG